MQSSRSPMHARGGMGAILALLVSMLVFSTSVAHAGTVYFYYAGGSRPAAPAGLYAVSDSGSTGPVLLAAGADFAGPYFGGVSSVPSWKTYANPVAGSPASRRWLVVRPQATDPSTGIEYGELAYFTLDSHGNATTVPITDFAPSGVLIPTSGFQTWNTFSLNWSNDGQDGFVSFTVLDPASNSQRHVRLNIAGSNLPTPADPYLVTPADPRVQTVLRSSSPYNSLGPILGVSWRADGTKLAFHNSELDVSYSQLRIKAVGPPGTDDTLMPETALLDSRTTTAGSFINPRWSPAADRIAFSNSYGTLYTVNAVAGASPQVLLSKPPGSCQRADWSPVGDSIAFDSDTFKGQNYLGPHTQQIQRAPSSGGKNASAVILTSSLDPYGYKVMNAWRP